MNYLEFEKPLAEIEGKAEELRAMARANPQTNVEKEAAALDKKAADMLTIKPSTDIPAIKPSLMMASAVRWP